MPEDNRPFEPAPAKPAPVRLAKGQAVSLGCGTFMLIAFIVWFCAGRLTENVDLELKGIHSEIKDLQKSVQEQTSLIIQLKDQVEKLKFAK